MTTAAILRKYLRKRFNSISAVLGKPGQRLSVADFHILRVEIKKVKAVFALLHYCSVDFDRKKSFLPWRTLFRQAGRVRELQLELAIVSSFRLTGTAKGYSEGLKSRLKEQKESFYKKVDPKWRKRLEKSVKSMEPFIPYVTKKKLLAFLTYKRKKIKELLEKGKLKETEIHEIRQRMKEFNYLVRLFDIREMAFKRMGDFEEVLGRWHDLAVMTGHLRRSLRSGRLTAEEHTQESTLKQKLAAKTRPLLERIMETRKGIR